MTKRKWILCAAGLAILMLLAACGAADDNTANNGGGNAGNAANGGNGDTTAAANVEELYAENCVTCHGADMRGQDLATVGSRMSRDEIENKIRKGGGGMIAFEGRLSDPEIDALADWLAEKK